MPIASVPWLIKPAFKPIATLSSSTLILVALKSSQETSLALIIPDTSRFLWNDTSPFTYKFSDMST